jgi:hypothetical protein
MSEPKPKKGFLGHKEIEYIEKEEYGEYAYIDGEWIWLRKDNTHR